MTEEEVTVQMQAEAFLDACYAIRCRHGGTKDFLIERAYSILVCVDMGLAADDLDERDWQFRLAGGHVRECEACIVNELGLTRPTTRLIQALRPLAASIAIRGGHFVGGISGRDSDPPDSPEKMH